MTNLAKAIFFFAGFEHACTSEHTTAYITSKWSAQFAYHLPLARRATAWRRVSRLQQKNKLIFNIQRNKHYLAKL
jgi:hypothetical protein